MIDDFKHFISREDLFRASDNILLAVSGGLDSVVMAALFHQAGFQFAIAHVNFQLRGQESDRDEEFVRNLAQKYKVEFFVRHFETTRFSRSEKVSVQVAARQLRYRWFDEVLLKEGFKYVATAHHLDDQAETFLINLTRGTGIAGLHGILPKQGKVIRPLLFTFRAQIEAYAVDNKLEFVEDSSNITDKYLRNRIRHKIIPQLERLSPGFSRELTQTIGFIRDAEKIYRQTIEQKRKEIFIKKADKIYIDAQQFFSLKPLTSWAYEILSPFNFNLSNIRDIEGLAGSIPGKEVLSATHRAIMDRDNLIIAPKGKTGLETVCLITTEDLVRGAINSPLHLAFETLYEIPHEYANPATTAYLDFEKLDFPFLIRRWHRGDYFYPMGMTQRKKLSDFFTDMKFSVIEKEKQWIMCNGNDIAWIIGHRIDDRFKITSSTRKILKITLYPE